MPSLVKQSTTQLALKFFLTDSGDHISAKTGVTATVTIRKEGGSFGSPAGSVTEIANGWYQVAANATDTNTLGEILLHATGTGADAFDGVVAMVVAFDPQASNLGLDAAGVRSAVGLASANLDTQLAALPTAAGNATAVWGAGTRVLTAGTNIALAKGTGVTGFNDVSSSDVQTAASAALTAFGAATASSITTLSAKIPAALASGRMICDIKAVNGIAVGGSGTTLDPWAPA
jgi:hypothetical protein